MRKIEYELPRRIFEKSEERYSDVKTGHIIAVMKVELYKKIREVMVAYVIEKNCGKLLTIHPLQDGQKRNRIERGRWRKI